MTRHTPLLALILFGCPSQQDDTYAPFDTDTEPPPDTDLDSGSSTDSGTDIGSDSATDTGTATDSDSATDFGTDTDTGSATDSDSGTDTGSATDTDTSSATDSGTDTGSATDVDTGTVPRLPLVWHVDDDAPPGGDGLTWFTALQHPQQAVDMAMPGDEIWVAEGTYIPLQPPESVLTLIDGIAVYGGFFGSEVVRSDRDSDLYPTTLDGQYAARHVVVAASLATLDGFTITGGLATTQPGNSRSYRGGGVLVDGVVDFNLRASRVAYNYAGLGGGLAIMNSSTWIEDVLIDNNGGEGGPFLESRGGGAYSERSTNQWTHVVFDGNGDTYTSLGFVMAKALFVDNSIDTLSSCVFRNHTDTLSGYPIIFLELGVWLTLENCLIYGNVSDGPLIESRTSGSLVVRHSVIAQNRCLNLNPTEGVISVYGDVIDNSILWNNTPPGSPGYEIAGYNGANYIELKNTLTQLPVDVWQDLGGNRQGNPGFRDPENGDFHLTQGSPAIDAAWIDALPRLDADGLPPFDDPGTPNLGSGAVSYGDLGPFEFQGTTTLWLDEPSAPATWTVGEQRTITWHGGAGTIDVELQRDGMPWEPLATGLSATDGAWTWTVSGLPAQRAWVRVRQGGTTDLWDVADLPVEIVPAP